MCGFRTRKLWLFKYDVVELGFRAENLMVWRNITLRFMGWHFLLGCGDSVMRREDVESLGRNRGVREYCFVVVKWGIFGWLVRRFFRMSVVEWLYTFVPASVPFLVKIYPLTEKYNSMVKRLYFFQTLIR